MFSTSILQPCLEVSEAIVRFGANGFFQSTLLIALGLLVGWAVRCKGAAVQSAVYRLTLATALACPIVSLLLAAVGVPGMYLNVYVPSNLGGAEAPKTAAATIDVTPEKAPAHASLAGASSRDTRPTRPEPVDRREGSLAAASFPHDTIVREPIPTTPVASKATSALDWRLLAVDGLAAVWLLGSGLLLIRLLRGWRLAASLRRTASSADSPTISLCLALAERLGIRAPPVLRTPFSSSPLLLGTFRAAILLPEEDGEVSSREVLVHELAHLVRGDVAWNLLGRVGAALWFFQPLVWLLVRRMVVAAEEVCDDYVLHLGFDRPGYARRLVDIAEQYRAAPAIGVGVISPRSWVGRRVVRILDSSRQLSLCAGRRAVGIAVVAALTATILVGLVGIGQEEASAAPRRRASKRVVSVMEPEANADAQRARQITVRGKVLSPEGQSVADATVRAGVAHWAMLDMIVGPDGKLPVSETKTNANGEFTISFTTQPYGDLSQLDRRWRDIWKWTDIAASAPGYGAAWVTYRDVEPDRPITLQLVPDLPVNGRVIDVEGKPVAGLVVEVGDLRAAKDENLAPWIAGIKEGQLPWTAVDLAPKEIEPPIAGVPKQVSTDQQGRFEIHGVGRERHFGLKFQSETVAHREFDVVTRKMEAIERVILAPGYDRPEPSKQPVYGADFTVTTSPSRPIVGIVRDAKTGKPLAGVSVESDKLADNPFSQNRVLKTTTDAEGRYRLIGMPKGKDNRLMVVPNDDQPYLMRDVKLPDPEGFGAITADIELHRGVWITGRVTEKATGKPVLARLYYLPFHSNPFAKATPEFGENFNADGYQGRYESRANGTYRLVGLPGPAIVGAESVLRQYRVGIGADAIQGVRKEGHFDTYANPLQPGPTWPCVMKEINPPANAESVKVDLQMDSGKSVCVSMVDPDGKPISGVSVDGAASSRGGRDTIEEPSFAVTNLASGETRRLVFHHEKRKLGLVTQVKAEQPNSRPVVIQLQPVGTLKGRILLADGTPVVGASVEAILLPSGDFGQELRLGVTDVQGRFEFTLLPGVNYRLRIEGGNLKVDRADQVDFVEGDLSVKPNEGKDLGDVTLGKPEKAKPKTPAESKHAPTTSPVAPADKTTSMGGDTLFQTHDAWLFSFNARGRQCFIVADHVAFEKRETDHIVVKLDSSVSVNVPTTGKHRVRLVDKDGFTEVSIDPDKYPDKEQLIQEVIRRKPKSWPPTVH
jgi:beta-lactamase regulating signal transducer with metallopeptidase domain